MLLELYQRLYHSIFNSKYGIYIFLIIILYPIYPLAYPMILGYWLYKYFKGQSSFWQRQPIQSEEYGLIKSTDSVEVNYPALQLAKDESWWHLDTRTTDVVNFLSKHYEKDIQITSKYIKCLVSDEGYGIFGIKKAGQLIATIGAASTRFRIGQDHRKGFYVDLLCIDKQYRKSGYAVKLLEKLIDTWKKEAGEIMLFKLDNIPIGPTADFTFQYYMLDTATIAINITTKIQTNAHTKLVLVNESNKVKAYEYFISQLNRYEIVEDFSLERFAKMRTNYLVKDNGEIIGFVNLKKNKYKKGAEIVDVIDVIYCFGNKLKIMPLLLARFHRVQYYIFLDIVDHKDIIDIYKMQPLYTTKYYFYNYELLNKYEATDVGINRL